MQKDSCEVLPGCCLLIRGDCRYQGSASSMGVGVHAEELAAVAEVIICAQNAKRAQIPQLSADQAALQGAELLTASSHLGGRQYWLSTFYTCPRPRAAAVLGGRRSSRSRTSAVHFPDTAASRWWRPCAESKRTREWGETEDTARKALSSLRPELLKW